MSQLPTPVSLRVKPGPGRLAVTGIGNALLDVIVRDHNNLHARLGLTKGAMNLVDLNRAREIYDGMGPTMQVSGGSVANTIAGVASLGGTSAFLGKVGADEFGDVFAHDLRSLGVELGLARSTQSDIQTGRCHVFVTDDAQRTMATYLGAANQFQPDDVDTSLIERSEIVYIEGYLFDLPPAKEAIRRIVEVAHDCDTLVALSLSDSFCVERHHQDFLKLVSDDVDVLLSNEGEIRALFGTSSLESAFAAVDELGVLTVVTCGPAGAQVGSVSGVVSVPAADVEVVVDQNGAGDLFAAGFLFALALGADPVEATELGSMCAGEIITHLGARPEANLEEMAMEFGLL
ncbi:MAG: adenosine kinase [Actinomycetota bacterium]